MTNNCLNCNEELVGKYCNNCSQPASTHRFSLSHVFKHDFVHGIFHFDKGFFFTIKELFTRPGHSIREYVQGKRVKHFNYFATVLLLLTIIYFVKKWAKIESSDLFDTNVKGLLKVQKDYSKITVFLNIPIIALISFLLFQRSKQNYTENLVLNMYLLCGLTVISLILPICMIFTDNKEFLFIVNYFVTALVFLYIIIFYYQYFSVFNYKKYDLIIRIILISILYMAIKQLINTILNNVGLKYFH
ncbi:DUF3667 domain-containing protein [Elizabethkingia anophelis]|uniref:DUF3667 domain-containing protein n=1 Tax=Elizabethkingia anophelis TaxID=1117645 RepID=UPI0020B17992|nr:DUF3667 domain-containing protein [Elizabethkingia anophelis]MCT3989924.1 DUF3667 domain-containing protein [Elizabethkingia anophelis]MCT4007444.1 DUF3667 domain-containing protein [Elizabethkingia anophelis]MDV4139919.1 hypothetical protein [Elizabethkingia anophelis]UTF96666.1 DUF3667 domain-containing protein [Elizabethkingia anophelis]